MARKRATVQDDVQEGEAGPGPSSLFTIRKSLLPAKWQRFSNQMEGREYELPKSGANVTISDLIKAREERLAARQEEDVVDTDIEEPYAADRRVPGWVGVPDPTKYAPGTTYLSPNELQEEIKKGNVVASQDWRQTLASLQPWQLDVLRQMVEADYADNRILFRFAPGEVDEKGGVLSVVDLMRYVQHNPELEALVKAQRNIREGTEQGPMLHEAAALSQGLLEEVTGQDPTAAYPWSSVGCGFVWRRRPIRWLKGWGGQLDFTYDVFIHERDTEQLLAPKWAQRPTHQIYHDTQYWKDVLAAGPQLGMTFMIEAARDVPIQEARQTWADLLARRMATRGVPTEHINEYLDSLGVLLDAKSLVADTRLCNSLGTHIRAGSALMLTQLTEGRLLIQATSPDPPQTREAYVLGALGGVQPLCEAMTSLALGNGSDCPQEPPLDENLLPIAQSRVLAAINGYRAGAPELSGPNISVSGSDVPRVALLGLPKPSMFRLPRLGQGMPEGQQPPVVLTDLQEAVTLTRLHEVFCAAALAADRASEKLPGDAPKERLVAVRRDAAQAALSKGLADLGLPGLTLTGAVDSVVTAAGTSAALSPALPVQPLQT